MYEYELMVKTLSYQRDCTIIIFLGFFFSYISLLSDSTRDYPMPKKKFLTCLKMLWQKIWHLVFKIRTARRFLLRDDNMEVLKCKGLQPQWRQICRMWKIFLEENHFFSCIIKKNSVFRLERVKNTIDLYRASLYSSPCWSVEYQKW